MEKVYSYLDGFDKIYCYPNSNVLKNNLNIEDKKFLEQVERRLVSLKLNELLDKPIKGNFDFNHLKKIHKYLFEDLYAWAGIPRKCDLAKRNMFCKPQFIEEYAESIFSKLKEENYYFDYDYDKKIISLVNLFADINALHAFREGNGRTQREFIEQLSKANNIDLDLTRVKREDMIEACSTSMDGNYELLTKIFFDNAKPLEKNEKYCK